MAEISDTAFFDYLMAEYNQPFNGWDFSYLAERMTDIHTRKMWDYAASAAAAMKQARSMLDMRTGGGERLAQLLALQPVPKVYATEGYPPNVQVARERLESLGVTVYAVQGEHLPFANDELDLVVNRHGSYDPDEVRRVLKPGHLFITQQVGDQTNLRLYELLDSRGKEQIVHPGAPAPAAWNLAVATQQLQRFGWQIVEQQEAFYITRYHDVGAIVYYLKAIPWAVTDFSVEKYFDKLVEIHQLIQQHGPIDVPFHSFFIVARK
ncbi:MAG TPA: methyltransferase domain-containing protein [Ktedonobacteraceae bacterium]|nr:methyltransferase domain-containing protein [Ktedonobacteraceae bacterium]